MNQKCPNCKKELLSEHAFCPHCGFDLRITLPVQSKDEKHHEIPSTSSSNLTNEEQARFYDEKYEDKEKQINNEPLDKYRGVGGWLLLLCFALTIGSPLRTIYNLITSYNETSQYFNQFPGLQSVFYIDGLLSAVIMALSIRAGIALWSIKHRAVNIAKNYLLILLGYSVIAVFLPFAAGLPSDVNDAMVPEVAKGAIQSLFFIGVWYWYLNVSKRVKETYT